jgi:hypothetical protein
MSLKNTSENFEKVWHVRIRKSLIFIEPTDIWGHSYFVSKGPLQLRELRRSITISNSKGIKPDLVNRGIKRMENKGLKVSSKSYLFYYKSKCHCVMVCHRIEHKGIKDDADRPWIGKYLFGNWMKAETRCPNSREW